MRIRLGFIVVLVAVLSLFPVSVANAKLRVANTSAGAKKYAKTKLSRKNYNCLNPIIKGESGWNIHAWNRAGYYGLGQTRIGNYHGDLSAKHQVDWAIKYAKDRYGSICNAKNFWLRHRWW